MNEQPAPRLFARPRRRPPRRPRLQGLSFNRMLPNLLTLVGLCVGFTAIRYAFEDRFGAAVIAIMVAGVIDGLDGRLARLLKATSRFGAEFDSLSDFLCFGVSPALIIYFWSLQYWRAVGFVPVLIFAACMALRLARFNAALDPAPDTLHVGTYVSQAKFAYNFFTGVPAPAGAALSLLPLYLGLGGEEHQIGWLQDIAHAPVFGAIVLIGTALLAVSTLPVWSFKNFKVPSRYVLSLLLSVVIFAAILLADPWFALVLLSLVYLAILPFSRRSFKRLQAEAEARLHDFDALD